MSEGNRRVKFFGMDAKWTLFFVGLFFGFIHDVDFQFITRAKDNFHSITWIITIACFVGVIIINEVNDSRGAENYYD